MQMVILSGNPKKEGLCRSVTEAVWQGAREAGADIKEICMEGMARCRVCGDGWGICRAEHRCAFGDDGFQSAQEAIRSSDALAILTPVYWGEAAEGLKNFLDRLRRCEFGARQADYAGAMAGKPVLLVASAGGSGNGVLTCLSQMERFCQHTGAVVFDYVSVNRWNSDYKRKAAYTAAYVMAMGRHAGETVD